jgi:ribosomal 30S subunit maturation factor RimM
MTRPILFIAATALMVATTCNSALAQGLVQTIPVPADQQQSQANGYRTSMIIGREVVNEHNVKIGKVDDLIVTQSGMVPFVVLSVGGILGIDGKYVVVPFSSIEIQDNRLMFNGATKDSLDNLPAFKYHT